ncbi:hypothetical protein [Frankia sp. QA3]|uniref:hypothetical protein n=1 Tax=Frankia sp. QA3 TaxID=710111 RepID=UPI000561F6F9|nr:hypothetical protein [Frankia sp. QA3]
MTSRTQRPLTGRRRPSPACGLPPRSAGRGRPLSAALRGAADLVGPGGTLLVVAHDSANLTDGAGGPRDPAVLYTAPVLTAEP